MTCPICNYYMAVEADAGDPDVGYQGGEERFQCSNPGCELSRGWQADSDVEATVEALAQRESGGQAA